MHNAWSMTLLYTYVLGIMGFLFAVGTYAFCYRRWAFLSIADILVLSNGISFGAYSILEAFIQSHLVVSLDPDPVIVANVLSYVLISTVLIWTAYRLFNKKYRSALSLRHMVHNWGNVGEPQQLLLLAWVIAMMVFGYIHYGHQLFQALLCQTFQDFLLSGIRPDRTYRFQ